MPTPYQGVEANVPASRADTSVSIIVDSDAQNASSVNTPFQKLTDYVQRIVKKAGFLDLASTWTTLQTFSAGISASALAAPTVTADTFAFTSAVARFSYVDASQFKSSGTVSYTNGVNASEFYSSGSDAVTARIAAPAGATITGFDIIVINQANVVYSFTGTYLVRVSVSGTTLTRTQLHAAGGGGQTITIPADVTGALTQFLAVPLIASPGAVPTNGYLLLNLTMPGNANVKVQGVRLAYSLAAVAPST